MKCGGLCDPQTKLPTTFRILHDISLCCYVGVEAKIHEKVDQKESQKRDMFSAKEPLPVEARKKEVERLQVC